MAAIGTILCTHDNLVTDGFVNFSLGATTNAQTLDINSNMIVQGDITITDGSTAVVFDIATGRSLQYDGPDIAISSGGATTLTITGSGAFTKSTGNTDGAYLNIAHALGVLKLTGSVTVDSVLSSDDGGSIVVNGDLVAPTIKNLVFVSGQGATIDLDGGSGTAATERSLTITNPIAVDGVFTIGNTATYNTHFTSTGGITVSDGGTLAFTTAGLDTITTDVLLYGGTIDVDNTAYLVGDITVDSLSTIDVATTKSLIYVGSDIVLENESGWKDSLVMTITGTGVFDNNNDPNFSVIDLNGGALAMNGIGTVDSVEVSDAASIIVGSVAPGATAATMTAFAAPSGFVLDFVTTSAVVSINQDFTIGDGTLLVRGDNYGVVAGSGTLTLQGTGAANEAVLQNTNTGASDFNIPVVMADFSRLDLDENITFGQAISLTGARITFDIASGITFNFADAISIGADQTLVVQGGGTFNNSNAITLSDPDATFEFGANTTTPTTVTSLTYAASEADIKVAGGKGIITTLNNVPASDYKLDIEFTVAADSLGITNITAFDGADTLEFKGTGGMFNTGSALTLSAGGAEDYIIFGSDGLNFQSAVTSMPDSFEVNTATTLSGDITLDADMKIFLNEDLTLFDNTFTVDAFELSLQGTGAVTGAPIILNAAASNLRFVDDISVDSVQVTTVDNASIELEGGAGTLGTLDLNGMGLEIDFTSGDVLTINDSVVVAATKTLNVTDQSTANGGLGGTISGTGSIVLTAAATSEFEINDSLTVNIPVKVGPGLIDVNQFATFSSTGDITNIGDFTVDVAAGKKLTYAGDAIAVGANTFTFSGGGRFDNTNAVVLDSGSVLTLATALDTVASVSVGDKDATIDADGNAAIEALAVTAGGVKLDAAATLYLTGATTLPGNSTVTVMGAGTVAGATDADSSNALTFTATDTLRVTANNGIVTKKVMMTGGIMDFGSVSSGYDFAARTFFDGDIVIWNGAKNVDFTGDLTVATASTVTDTGDPSGMVKLGDGTNINMLENLTMEKSMVRIDYALGFTTDGAADTVTLEFDSVDFDNGLAKFGTDAADGEPIKIKSTLAKALITLPSTVDFAGTTMLIDDDTLLVDEVATINGNLVMNGTGELHIKPVAADPGITLNGTLQSINGTLEIDSVGSTSQGGIDFDTGGIYKVVDATGKIVLPRTKTTDLAGSAVNDVIVVELGVIEGSGTQSLGDPQHTIANADNDKVATMESGTIHNITFSTNVIAFTKAGNNVTGYFITVYVSILEGDDTDGTGSEVAPYATLEKGLTEAEDGSIIALAYGEYVLSAALAVDKQITFQGYDVKFDILGNSGALGANDLAPTITFAGTGDYLFDVQTTDVKFQGIKFNAPSVTSLFTFSTADTTINNFTLDGNNFTMSDGQVGVALTTAVGVKGVAITDNMFDIAAAGDMSTVLTLSTTMVDSADGVTITGNTIKGSQIMFDLGDAADIDVVTITGNTFMDGAGIMFDESVDQSTKMINDVTITGNTFKGNMSNAVMLSTDIEITDVDGTMNNDFDLTDNHFFFTGTAITNGVTATNDSTVHKVAATDNWWGSFGGPAAGYATYTGAVEYIEWKYVPVLAGGEVITTEVASATAYTGFDITVFSGTAGYYTVSTNFAADFAAGPHVITANNPDALTDNTITITPTDINGFTGGVVTVELNDGAGNVYTATSNTFDVAAATVSPIGSALTATDFPGDAGGYVQLSFVASPNHAGFGTAVDGLLIDYYQIYRASVDDFGQAVNWAYFVATPKATGQNDTLRVVVDTKGATGTAFYWIAAVKGNLPVVATKAAQVNGVLAAFSVEETPATASFKTATVGDDGRITSSVSNSNRALPVDNNRGAGDWTGAVGVGLDDFAAFVGVYDVAAEYDVVFDLDVDGAIGLSDLAAFVTQYYASTASASKVRPVMESGLNKEGSLEAKTDFDFDTEYLDLTVTADDIKSLTGYGYRLDFDPTVYELVEIVNGDLLRSNGGDVGPMLKHIHNGTIVVAEVLTGLENAAQGEGIITTFRFRWIGDDNSSINISNIDLLDGNSEITHFEDILVEKPVALPVDYQLMDNYPNPFNPTTTISFALPVTEHVKIEVCNVLGQTIRTLVDTEMKAGVRTVKWDGRNDYGIQASTGIYFYRIQAGSFTEAKKMNLIK
ncbi:FlgD immunoglobulin-like domain containing protein [candidate division KSB1 bacterium]